MQGYIERKLEEALGQTEHWLKMAKNRLATSEFVDAMEYAERSKAWANFAYGIFIGVQEYDFEGLDEEKVRRISFTAQNLQEEAHEIWKSAINAYYDWLESLEIK